MGRFIPEKNHTLLLELFSQFQRRAATIVLVGHGLGNHIKTQISAEESELVHAPFPAVGPAEVLYWSSYVNLPSSKDTGPSSQQAMASSLPVIGSSSCGCVDDLLSMVYLVGRFNMMIWRLSRLFTCSDAQTPRQRELMTVAHRD